MKLHVSVAAIALSSAIAACDSASGVSASTRVSKHAADSLRADSIALARQDSLNRAQPGYVVDSALSVDEEVRRFRLAVGGSAVTSFAHASASRDELVKRLVRGVARADTNELRHALVSPREFVDLIYPSSPYTHPPYRQSPGLVWMTITNHSASGLSRLLARRSEGALELSSYSCDAKPDTQGENKLWAGCVVHLTNAKGDSSTQRWFGTIVERDGKFKLLSYRNQF
jgi:hypothetical protein